MQTKGKIANTRTSKLLMKMVPPRKYAIQPKSKKTSESKNDKNYGYKRDLPQRVYKSHDDSECTRVNQKKLQRVNMVNHENSHEPDTIFSDEEFIGMVNLEKDIEHTIIFLLVVRTTRFIWTWIRGIVLL